MPQLMCSVISPHGLSWGLGYLIPLKVKMATHNHTYFRRRLSQGTVTVVFLPRQGMTCGEFQRFLDAPKEMDPPV